MFPKQSLDLKPASADAASTNKSTRVESKVEVSFELQEGAEVVALRYMTWTEGLGWCCQKTIRVEENQLDELHRALAVARQRARRRAAEVGTSQTPAKVIRFPSLA